MISVVIPIKNEAKNLPKILKIINSLKLKEHDIIIVDDDSQDGTQEILKKLSKKYPIYSIIRKNRAGYGSALKEGFEKALSKKSDVIITMDADFSHNPQEIPKLVEKIKQGNNIVIGSRYVKFGKIKNWSLLRRFLSRSANAFTQILLSTKIKDNTSGFRAYSPVILKKITPKLKSNSYTILEEILFIARKENAKIIEVPITFKDRTKGASKARIINEAKNLLKLAVRLRKESINRFLKFCLVGLSGIIVNQGLLWLLTEKANLYYLFSGFISIESSIITNFFLNDIWTFKKQRKSILMRRLAKFNLARILTLLINLFVLWILTTLGMNYLISNLIGIAVATLLAYSISSRWVWKS